MHITRWKEEADRSYHEAFVSIREGLTYIFKVRAVKMSDGKYMAVVRDYHSGHMLGSRQAGINKGFDLQIAKNIAIELISLVLYVDGMAQCVVKDHMRICPHLTISGTHCSYCKIPDVMR